jgi:hypothetical protein
MAFTRRAAVTSIAAAPFLAGCAQVSSITSAVTCKSSATTSSSAAAQIASVTTLWGVVYGVGKVALGVLETADPAVGIIIASAEAVAPLIAQLPALASDAVALASAVSTIQASAHSVLLAAAPVIQVVPNGATTTKAA